MQIFHYCRKVGSLNRIGRIGNVSFIHCIDYSMYVCIFVCTYACFWFIYLFIYQGNRRFEPALNTPHPTSNEIGKFLPF